MTPKVTEILGQGVLQNLFVSKVFFAHLSQLSADLGETRMGVQAALGLLLAKIDLVSLC